MELPKVNEKKQKSKIMSNKLRFEIQELITKFEIDNNYEFLSYEVDSIFLEMIQSNHRSYLRSKFGDDII